MDSSSRLESLLSTEESVACCSFGSLEEAQFFAENCCKNAFVTYKLLGLHRNSVETDEQIVAIKRQLVGLR
jgi:hypothetical protein